METPPEIKSILKEIKFNKKKSIYKIIVNREGFRVSEHRDVWERHHGKILKGSVIHHINLNPLDNNINNLMMMTVKEHSIIHKKLRDK